MLTKQAIELLQKVKAHVLEEPKRLNMNCWLQRKTNVFDERPYGGFPACGVVGCIAGWVCILGGEPNTRRDNAQSVASSILGLGPCEAEILFLDMGLLDDGLHNGQTLEHAKRVAEHIDRFIAERS